MVLNYPKQKVPLLVHPGRGCDAGGNEGQELELAGFGAPAWHELGNAIPFGRMEGFGVEVGSEAVLVEDVEEVVSLIHLPVFAGLGSRRLVDESPQHFKRFDRLLQLCQFPDLILEEVRQTRPLMHWGPLHQLSKSLTDKSRLPL